MFMSVKNLVMKHAGQNSIPMAKLVKLCNKVVIPEEDKGHFFEDFGKVVKKLLQIREPHTFFTCLQAFMEWANQTEL